MRKIIILICGMLAFMATAAAQDPGIEETTIIKAGMTAPEFTVKMLDGTEIKSTDLKGKVVLLNFWATWCGPCRQEFARVQADIIDRFKGKDLVFIALSRGEEKDRVDKFIETNNYTFPVGLDSDSSVYKKFASNYIPRNFVIGRDGKVVLASVGYEPEGFEAMIKLIDGLL